MRAAFSALRTAFICMASPALSLALAASPAVAARDGGVASTPPEPRAAAALGVALPSGVQHRRTRYSTMKMALNTMPATTVTHDDKKSTSVSSSSSTTVMTHAPARPPGTEYGRGRWSVCRSTMKATHMRMSEMHTRNLRVTKKEASY